MLEDAERPKNAYAAIARELGAKGQHDPNARIRIALRRLNPECRGDLVEHHHRRVPDSAFDAADVGAVQAAPVGEVLLRPAFLAPEPLQVQAFELP